MSPKRPRLISEVAVTTRTYTIILEPEAEEGGFSVFVPALPGCVTQGETIEECIVFAREAIGLWIAEAEGEEIPEERAGHRSPGRRRGLRWGERDGPTGRPRSA